jgi:TPP-dependent trihydroxycyclohexane-1,2-dione (THcHDO) dehydratase
MPAEGYKGLQEARKEKRACAIGCEVEKHRYSPDNGVWWDLAAAEGANDPVTQELRQAYEKARHKQRFYY